MSLPESCYEESGMLYCERRIENNNTNKKSKAARRKEQKDTAMEASNKKGTRLKGMTVC